jgi:hypothetical protein
MGNDVNDLLNKNQLVMVGENTFGKVDIKGAMEIEITNPQ